MSFVAPEIEATRYVSYDPEPSVARVRPGSELVQHSTRTVLPSTSLSTTPLQVRAVQTSLAGPADPGIEIEIEHGDGCFTVADRASGIFGAGTTLADAFGDLATALIEHRDVLERQDGLSPDLARQLGYLRRLVPAE